MSERVKVISCKKMLLYLDENLGEGKHIAVADMAAVLNITGGYLNKLCKALIGLNAQDVIAEKKIEKAIYFYHVLGNDEKSIAEKLGYASTQAFCQFFKNKTKKTLHMSTSYISKIPVL